jgi:hypothetical protein
MASLLVFGAVGEPLRIVRGGSWGGRHGHATRHFVQPRVLRPQADADAEQRCREEVLFSL